MDNGKFWSQKTTYMVQFCKTLDMLWHMFDHSILHFCSTLCVGVLLLSSLGKKKISFDQNIV